MLQHSKDTNIRAQLVAPVVIADGRIELQLFADL